MQRNSAQLEPCGYSMNGILRNESNDYGLVSSKGFITQKKPPFLTTRLKYQCIKYHFTAISAQFFVFKRIYVHLYILVVFCALQGTLAQLSATQRNLAQ